jgi:hypothetical protein
VMTYLATILLVKILVFRLYYLLGSPDSTRGSSSDPHAQWGYEDRATSNYFSMDNCIYARVGGSPAMIYRDLLRLLRLRGLVSDGLEGY